MVDWAPDEVLPSSCVLCDRQGWEGSLLAFIRAFVPAWWSHHPELIETWSYPNGLTSHWEWGIKAGVWEQGSVQHTELVCGLSCLSAVEWNLLILQSKPRTCYILAIHNWLEQAQYFHRKGLWKINGNQPTPFSEIIKLSCPMSPSSDPQPILLPGN